MTQNSVQDLANTTENAANTAQNAANTAQNAANSAQNAANTAQNAANTARDLAQRTVGEVVAEDYRRAAVFERYGIDFCCGGNRSVGDACEASGVVYDDVARALDEADAAPAAASDVRSWPLNELADHIVAVHHRYVRESLPPLLAFSEKVARVHGERHAELLEIQGLVSELAEELTRHMEAEENMLFPRVAEMAGMARAGQQPGEGRPAGAATPALAAPLDMLEDDHEHAGDMVHRIRSLSGDFTPPEDGCTTYRAFYAELAEFESDLHRHVHLENNVLFPGLRALVEAQA